MSSWNLPTQWWHLGSLLYCYIWKQCNEGVTDWLHPQEVFPVPLAHAQQTSWASSTTQTAHAPLPLTCATTTKWSVSPAQLVLPNHSIPVSDVCRFVVIVVVIVFVVTICAAAVVRFKQVINSLVVDRIMKWTVSPCNFLWVRLKLKTYTTLW